MQFGFIFLAAQSLPQAWQKKIFLPQRKFGWSNLWMKHQHNHSLIIIFKLLVELIIMQIHVSLNSFNKSLMYMHLKIKIWIFAQGVKDITKVWRSLVYTTELSPPRQCDIASLEYCIVIVAALVCWIFHHVERYVATEGKIRHERWTPIQWVDPWSGPFHRHSLMMKLFVQIHLSSI